MEIWMVFLILFSVFHIREIFTCLWQAWTISVCFVRALSVPAILSLF